jgi:hypothetical protein
VKAEIMHQKAIAENETNSRTYSEEAEKKCRQCKAKRDVASEKEWFHSEKLGL